MPNREAHMKPCYMLETPKAQSATYEKISGDEAIAEMGNQQVTQYEIGWLAGFVDGEGYIGISQYKTRRRKTSYSCAIQVSNTDEKMILKAQQIVQKIGVNPYIRTHGYGERNKKKSKIVYVLVVHRMGKIIPILEAINPYLTGLKKERADLVLEYCKSRMNSYVPGSHYNVITERESQIIELCIAKQKRGTSETTRKAQLERKEKMMAQARQTKKEYDKKYSKDPVNRARATALQRERRALKRIEKSHQAEMI